MLRLTLRKEAGSITAIAVMLMVVFGILLAGLLPFTKEVGRSAFASQNNLNAQYVAEAGLKRAIVNFLKDRKDWAWLGQNVPFANGAQYANYTYNVVLNPAIEDGKLSDGNKFYIITSVGRTGSSVQQVSCKVRLDLVTKTVTKQEEKAGELTANLPNGTLYIGGDLLVKNNFSVDGDVVCGGKIVTHNGKNFNGSGQRLQGQTNMKFPSYDLDKYNGFKSAAAELPTFNEDQTYNLDGGLYYVDGDLNIDKNQITFNCSKPTVIFVKNDMVVSGNGLEINGNVMIVALGQIRNTNGSNKMKMSSAVLVAGGGVDFENGNNIDIGGQVVTKGNLNLKNNDDFVAIPGLAQIFNELTQKITITIETQTTETGKDFANMAIYDWNTSNEL